MPQSVLLAPPEHWRAAAVAEAFILGMMKEDVKGASLVVAANQRER